MVITKFPFRDQHTVVDRKLLQFQFTERITNYRPITVWK